MADEINSYTPAGAELLAFRIRRYWEKAGYPKIKVWIEAGRAFDQNLHGVQIFEIKSNLNQNGFPPE
jgi:hypothetical protein